LVFEVTDLETGCIHYSLNASKRSTVLKIDTEYDKVIEYYNKLANSAKSRFKEPITRAISLFRTGYWDFSRSSQFRNYWIALEQLIESAKPKRLNKLKSTTSQGRAKIKQKLDIIDYVPRLTITWKSTPGTYIINGMLGSIRAEISSNQQLSTNLSHDPRLRQWDSDDITILENTRTLLRNISNNTIRQNLRELSALFRGKKKQKLKEEVLGLRQSEELRIGILKAKRNELTHEGIAYFQAEKIYTRSMEHLLVDVLEAFLSNLDAKNIDVLIRKCNRPLAI
jgi:hypothetical protein